LPDKTRCPVCGSTAIDLYHSDRRREFFKCSECGLVYVPEKYHLSEKDERSRYDKHENTPDNSGYADFLNRFYSVVRKHIKAGNRGLDFGSGPEPLLAEMFSRNGYYMSVYDPFYAPDKTVFQLKYDFITISEVLEHIKYPVIELKKLWNCLNPGGIIGIMTKFLPENIGEFSSWNYKNDSTHISFYNEGVFEWISELINSQLVFPAKDIVLMYKTK